jgi:GTPase SAR1 family protein
MIIRNLLRYHSKRDDREGPLNGRVIHDSHHMGGSFATAQVENTRPVIGGLALGLGSNKGTTVFYKMAPARFFRTDGARNSDVDIITYKNFDLHLWHVDGKDLSEFWRSCGYRTHVLIFVVDSRNPARLDEARDELHKLLKKTKLQDAILLVIANRQDLPEVMTMQELETDLKLDSISNRIVRVQGVSTLSGYGIYQGFKWLGEQIDEKLFRVEPLPSRVSSTATLYHMTSARNAVAILRKQKMFPGQSGSCGAGIYFAPDPAILYKKARVQGVTLCAEVDLGLVMEVQLGQYPGTAPWWQIVRDRGCDSVHCTGFGSGEEYIVYEPERVKSIVLYPGDRNSCTGTLQKSADGTNGTGMRVARRHVRIAQITPRRDAQYPILLAETDSPTHVGWSSADSLSWLGAL